MLINDLKLALRAIRKHKGYSAINIFGLAIGMACCLIILLFVHDELSYDRFHQNADRIYRVVTDITMGGNPRAFATAFSGLGSSANMEMPEIETYTRLGDLHFVQGEALIEVDGERFNETGVLAADASFFDVFSYEFLAGDPESALEAPGSVVITGATAEKMFGTRDAMGRRLRLSLQGDFQVTGIVKTPPANAHFTFNYLFTTAGLKGIARQVLDDWGGFGTYTYLLLAENAEPNRVTENLNDLLAKKMPPIPGASFTVSLQKLTDIQHRYKTITEEMRSAAGAASASITSGVPGRTSVVRQYAIEGRSEQESQAFDTILGDFNFARTYDIPLVAGRDLSASMASDSTEAFLINEAAAQKLGWQTDEAIGKRFGVADQTMRPNGRLVGVMQDFHHSSLKQAVEPLVVKFDPQAGFSGGYLSVRLRTSDLSATIAALKEKWLAVEPEQTFDYFFLRDDFDRQYRAEERLGTLTAVSAGLAIFVACLGLFAFAAFTAEQRTKEIGIRKVLGATVANVTALLSKEFVRLVLIANVLAWPLAWFVMNRWLQNFAYRVELGWWVFVLAGGLALLIALVTVSAQAIKAALANPVESLRYE